MGHKKVCLECRVTLNRPFDGGSEFKYPCPECGKPMILFSHRFRPPKKSEDKKWETVIFLVNSGFYFQHIYEKIETTNGLAATSYRLVDYPENIRDAKEFVEKFKEQAWNMSK